VISSAHQREEEEAGSRDARRNTVILSILISSLVITFVQQGLSIGLAFLFAQRHLSAIYLISIVSFLINPVVLVVVLYLIGQNIDIRKFYLAIAVSLFLG
jgi:hypothetical protein